MTLRQLQLWPDQPEYETGHDPTIDDIASGTKQTAGMLVHDRSAYASLKRISVVHEGNIRTRPTLSTRNASKEFFADYWRENPANDQERFVVACLDVKNYVQCVVVVTIGTLDASLVHPREVFKPAIIEGSSSVVLSHNHPSGDTTPSREDRAVTTRLTEAGELLGIAVLDHIIYGDATGHVISIHDS